MTPVRSGSPAALLARDPPRARAVAQRVPFNRDLMLPFLLLLPSMTMILLVVGYPFVAGFWYSLNSGSLLRQGAFVGLANYAQLFSMEAFQSAAWFSFLFALCNVVGCYLLGLGLAMLMNMDVPGRGFFRIALLLPWIIPSVVSIVSWRWLLADRNAPINQIISAFGGDPIYFLSSDHWAVVAVIIVKIWRSFPFMMLSLLAALQGIDRTLYEAASLDGATRWQTFRFVTMPQLRDISIILCILMTIWSVNDYDTPFLLTGGGPAYATENFVLVASRYTFARNDVGIGSAVSFVTLAILTVLAVILLRRQRRENVS
jgi:multiple sugar transport system permease protein